MNGSSVKTTRPGDTTFAASFFVEQMIIMKIPHYNKEYTMYSRKSAVHFPKIASLFSNMVVKFGYLLGEIFDQLSGLKYSIGRMSSGNIYPNNGNDNSFKNYGCGYKFRFLTISILVKFKTKMLLDVHKLPTVDLNFIRELIVHNI